MQDDSGALPARLPMYAASYDADRDKDYRVALLTKLFNLYPLHQHQELRLAMLGYLEELDDVPTWALDLACTRLVREPGRAFRPSVGELRNAAGLCVMIRTQGTTPDRRNSDAPLSRAMLRKMLERGRRLVGHPEPQPSEFLTGRVRRLVIGEAPRQATPALEGGE